MGNLSEREIYDRETATNGLARGDLKVDSGLVRVGENSRITGEEKISSSTLHHEIATEALGIHDRLVAAGEIEANSPIRAHILRVIELSADPVR